MGSLDVLHETSSAIIIRIPNRDTTVPTLSVIMYVPSCSV